MRPDSRPSIRGRHVRTLLSHEVEYHQHSSIHRLRLAAGALTLWRVPPRDDENPRDLRESTAFYPLVGLGVGLLPAAVLLLDLHAGPRAALALAAWAVATGATTLVGWARSCDAALTPLHGRQRRLRMLRTRGLGAFGAVGLVLLMLGKWSALAHAPAFAPLVAAPLGRWAMVHALRTYAPAERDRPEAVLSGAVPLWAATWVAVAVLGLVTAASPDPARTALAVTVGTLLSLAAVAFLVDRFAGVSGPACAVACEAAEVGALFALLPWG
jgi:adenosylcobinamide-GDP ribazoletransferase